MTNAEKFAKLNGIDSIKDGEGYYPDFEDAKSILEVMKKRIDWSNFVKSYGSWGEVDTFSIYYILNPDKLLDEAIKFCEENPL